MWLGIGDALEHWARYKPHKTAVRIGKQNIDFKTLYERAISISTFIIKAKVEGRVCVGVTDKFEYLACIAGVNLAGNSIVVLNPSVNQESLSVHIIDTKPSMIIGHSDLIDTVNKETRRRLQTMNISEIPLTKDAKLMTRSDSKEWGVLFSSGSTGISKAIVYDSSTMSSELIAWCLELGIRRETRFYIGRPLHYTGGLVLTLSTLLVGGEVILPEYQYDNDYESIWKHYQMCIDSQDLDFSFFIPDQLRTFIKLAREPLGGPTILVMGAPISGDEKKDVSNILKSPLIESWGNSEGLGTITDKEDLSIRPNSIGRPFLTEKLCAVTDELVKCEPNQIGRLAGSEETMFIEYANRPEATKRVKKNNLVLSDDIGYMDENYYFYILGRDQESFVIEGKMVFISEMEKKARKISGISDVCIVAVETKSTPNFYALIVPKENASKDLLKTKIQKAFNDRLTDFLFVDNLPRLSSGKINRLEATKLVS